MSCANCSNNINGKPNGCRSNGHCVSGGCSQMSSYNWLTNLDLDASIAEVAEISFKNGRKGFFYNEKHLPIYVGDAVVVEASPGKDVGMVSLTGELVKHQMARKKVKTINRELRKVVRKAQEDDILKWKSAKAREEQTMHRARAIVIQLNIQMKLSDVEFQGDESKAIFYYTAESRIDFRELIRRLADEFKIRIEMKQIGSRQEAARIGGIGSCGRELCCSTWMSDFRSVTTGAARYQQLSLNPQKLAGQCGKLKCCLNFELDQYVEQVKKFPSPKKVLESKTGKAKHFKTDVFKNTMFYFTENSSGASSIVEFSSERVHEIIKMNSKGEKPADFSGFVQLKVEKTGPDFDNVVGQDDLTRFDKVFKKKKSNKRKRNKNFRNKKQGPKAKK
ncbi:MAG: stage 0 sporulation family protein [Parvicellaceae bacterium]